MRPESILARLVLVIILLVASIIAVLVFALYRGVNVDSLSFGSVQIERLSAHLDGKLSLDIGRVAVTRKPSQHRRMDRRMDRKVNRILPSG
jgi:hypothetical protein